MVPRKEFSARANARILKDAQDAVKERDRMIILLTAEKNSEHEHVARLQNQLDKERIQYKDRLVFIDKAYGEERTRVRKLQSIIKVLEATIFCLTKKSLQIDGAAGGGLDRSLQVIDEEYKPPNRGIAQAGVGGFGGSPPKSAP